ncbi:LacI family DNA-binding transcriptional regulator [Alkalibacillus salilacus]|uniref:Alanine racemase n=1 Tax=Alkalibacillus salilacus TaxID=284582 RepID=A0ABT9VBB9_9BACI|nr:LacI family DNA-binding transcriptional regulator [Alkalibacillus salilacus]MDQ0158236.1 alanine racemase [Alkalibacillus salilacus]
MANINEVAKKAGVSVATVSRVLNSPNVVTPRTKAKVEDAIKKLNYEPSMLGRNLRNSESRLLLVLVPSISNPFYIDIIKGIEQSALDQNYNILLCETDSNPEREEIYFDLVRKKMADGIISMDPAVNIETLKELSKQYAIIQCSEYSEESDIPYVTIDNEEAAYRAVKHLIKLGHQEIALFNSNEKYLYARERKEGYMRALQEYGLPINDEFIIMTDQLNFDSGIEATKRIMNLKDRPTAIFSVSDLLAVGALKEMNRTGVKVPEEMAIIGFDNIEFSNMTYPTLTTIAQPMYQLGTVAANMLIEKVNGGEVTNTILNHELLIREST